MEKTQRENYFLTRTVGNAKELFREVLLAQRATQALPMALASKLENFLRDCEDRSRSSANAVCMPYGYATDCLIF